MRTRFKVILRIIIILIVIVVVTLISLQFKTPSNKPTYQVIDNIKNYNYTLDDRDSKIMAKNFQSLRAVLEESAINYEEYAKYLSSLFVIDLFTLANKDNKYDVGSTEYVYDKILENYKLNVTDTLYKYIGEFAKDQYPTVKDIKDVTVTETKYTYDNKEYDGYNVNISWDYEKDLGYYQKADLILIKVDNKLSVVSFKGVE